MQLRDRDGNAVAVEAVHLSTTSIAGDISHQVGLREQVDSAEKSLSVVSDCCVGHDDATHVWFDPHTLTVNSCSTALTSSVALHGSTAI